MGRYLPGPAKGKAEYILKIYKDAIEIDEPPEKYGDVPSDTVLVIVVDNGPFEAAALAYTESEFKYFLQDLIDDPRPRKFLLVPRKEVGLEKE